MDSAQVLAFPPGLDVVLLDWLCICGVVTRSLGIFDAGWSLDTSSEDQDALHIPYHGAADYRRDLQIPIECIKVQMK